MKVLVTMAAVGLFFGLAQAALADEPQNAPVAAVKLLYGEWNGLAACQGDLTLRADGTFEKTKCGPGGDSFAGVWEVRWDALPPTLVMICKVADDPTAVGKSDAVKVVKLDGNVLVVSYPSNDFPWQYSRVKK